MPDDNGDRCDLDELRDLFIFEGLTHEQLDRLCRSGYVKAFPEGVLCQEGEPAASFYVLLDGEIALSKRSGDRDIDVWRSSEPGSYCGAWSAFLLDETLTYENTATLTRPSRMLALNATAFGTFLQTEFPMATHLLAAHSGGRMYQRLILDPHDRLLQLGQLTAGMTHELNNPAAAAVRASAELRVQVGTMRQRLAALAHAAISPDSVRSLVELQDSVAERAGKSTGLTTMEEADLEEALGAWLDEHQLADAWDLAATFAEAGLGVDWMERILGAGGDSSVPLEHVLQWLSRTIKTELLLNEITDATQRISAFVHRAKQYSQVDRAPFDLVNVNALLDTTLAMLSHRLGPGITVTRDFEQDLPALPCWPAELNQVWTNLINNALDAMPTGVLTLRTRRHLDMVRIQVCDNGVGIPEENLARVFDPFFTTKPFGQGIGLGLDTAARIIDRHGGSLWVESEPGATRFVAALPLTAPAADHSSTS